jgi:hypothetical protein
MTEAARGTAELTQAFEILAERDIDLVATNLRALLSAASRR